MELNQKQTEAFNLLLRGYNVFLTGAAGTGKTTVIRFFKEHCQTIYKKVALTSTTGVSALLIGGTTLHAFAGIGLGIDSVEKLIESIQHNKWVSARWRVTKVLVIDEVSMLKPELLMKLNQIAQAIRNNSSSFGGIQVILTGDFAQLPPIYTEDNEPKDEFAFQSPVWDQIVQKTVCLTEIMRQKDEIFQKCLSEVRLANVSANTFDILHSRVIKFNPIQQINGIIPTRLFARKRNVEEINNSHFYSLQQAGNETQTFNAEIQIISKRFQNIPQSFKDALIQKIHRNCPAPQILELVVGAQVMLNYNIDLDNGFVNGSRGVLVKFQQGLPVVRFLNGELKIIKPVKWELKEDDSLTVFKKQIPLMIAYASTIHKVQGATLDFAIIDAGPNIFQFGQIYTALSRVKSLEGLYLTKLDPEKIKCHPEVLNFYKN